MDSVYKDGCICFLFGKHFFFKSNVKIIAESFISLGFKEFIHIFFIYFLIDVIGECQLIQKCLNENFRCIYA